MWLMKLVFTDENVAADGVKLMTTPENRLQRKGDNFKEAHLKHGKQMDGKGG